MNAGCRELGGDAAAYALGALEEREASAFAGHLATCAACRAELDALTAVTQRLAVAVPQYAAPRRLRRAVLSEIAAPRRRWRPARRPLAAWAVALGAVALAAVAVGAWGAVGSWAPGPAARTIEAWVAEPHARAELRLTRQHAELLVRGMPEPAAGDVYEVWLVRRTGGAPRPTAALFSVTSSGDGVVAVPGDLRALRAVLVTEEPAGGTRVPTSRPVIEARLT